MTHPRRHFALWSGAALLPDADPAASPICFRPGAVRSDGPEVTVEVEAWNRGEPTSARVAKVSAELRSGAETTGLMSWVNDAHPWSRRLVPPAFVDLPADQTLALAEIHVQRPPGWQERECELVLELRITDRLGTAQTVTLRLPLHAG